MPAFEDLTGQIFTSLTVLNRGKTVNRKTKWICQCKCGCIKEVTAGDLKCGDSTSCGKCDWHKFIQDSWWSEIQKQAKRRKLVFELDKDYLYDLWLKQNGRCALSNLELFMPDKAREQRGPRCTASIDRIDNTKGYIKGNVQWVNKDINRMRGAYTIEKYINMCKAVAKTQELI